MTLECPTCGQPLPDIPLKLHADAGVAVARGKFVWLPRREMLILEFLVQRTGRFVTREQIFAGVYGHGDDLETDTVVESHISKLRKKVLAIGVNIRSERFRGYQLTMERGDA
jgi:DNA-binding response OmpR family regulator